MWIFCGKKRLKCLSHNNFGANRRLHSAFRAKDRLDIYILRLIKRLCSIGELLSRLRRKAYHKMMIHSLYILDSALYFIYSFNTTLCKHLYQRTVRKLSFNGRIYQFFLLIKVLNFDVLKSALIFWLVFVHILFKRDLKFCLLSITIPRTISSVTFSVIKLLTGKS